MQTTDVLVIGSGIAGATAALTLAKNPNRQVSVITRKRDSQESNTRYAQGGMIGGILFLACMFPLARGF